MKIILIGAGNLATPVGRALKNAGHEILQVWSHTAEHAEELASLLGAETLTDLSQIRTDADLYLYAVKDAYLQQVVDSVAQYVQDTGIHAHTAGSMSVSVFDGRQAHGAVFYPYQSFSRLRMPDFQQVPVFLEAKEEDYPLLEAVARSISPKVYAANSEQRKRIHLAGVFANNFSNCMYRICKEQIEQAGLPFDTMLGLIDETARKVHEMSPKEAQTGPACRKDENVMEEHKKMLAPTERAIYEAVSQYIMMKD